MASDDDAKNEGGIQSLSRAFALLETIARHPEGIGLSDVCRATGLHSSTGFHLVKTMLGLGYLRQANDSKRYFVGPRAFCLAATARSEVQLVSIAEPVIQKLAALSRSTVAFGLRVNDEMVILSRAHGAQGCDISPRLRASSEVNHCTAMGKLVLAEKSPDQLEAYLAGRALKPFTPRTITDRAALAEEVARARSTGFAFEDGELQADMRSVAAPVRDFTHQVIGALALFGSPATLSLQALHEQSVALRKAAAELSTQLGYQPFRGYDTDERFPSRPVRIVVPFAPGGSLDTVARLLSPALSFSLRQPVLVENRPGGGGMHAAELVARSPADGHTVLLTSSSLAAAPALYRRLPFDPRSDFVPVTQLLTSDYWLVVTPRLPVRSLGELIALARRPRFRRLRYGHTGAGSPAHLTMELFKALAGVDVAAAAFEGMAPLDDALASGEVDAAVVDVASSHAHARAGRIRPLAVTSPRRLAAFPLLPTGAEAGLPGFEASGWNSLFVPAQTPAAIVRQLQVEAVKALEPPDVRNRLPALGLGIVGSDPDRFAAKFMADIARFALIVRDAQLPAQQWTGA
ncbi:MAG TPA: tripartite tricarboxylate transporter substrate-binding protein [Burkholderiales bacterium]